MSLGHAALALAWVAAAPLPGDAAVPPGAPAAPVAPAAAPCASEADLPAVYQCMQTELRRSDNQLHHQLEHLLDAQPAGDPRRGRIVEAQRAWVRFRNAECTQRLSDTDGTLAHEIERLRCLIAQNGERAGELQRQAGTP